MCSDYRGAMLLVVLPKEKELEKLTELQLTAILFFLLNKKVCQHIVKIG